MRRKLDLYQLLNKIDEKSNLPLYRIKIPTDLENFAYKKDRDILDSVIKALTVQIILEEKTTKITPAVEFYGDWRTVGSQDFTEKDYQNLRKLQKEKLSDTIRARIQDILWIQEKDFLAANDAIDCYKSLFIRWFTIDNWYETIDYLNRGIMISKQLRNREKKNELLDIAFHVLADNIKSGNTAFQIRILELLIYEKYRQPNDYIKYIDEIRSSYHGNNSFMVERLFDLEYLCYCWKEDQIGKESAQIQKALYFEETASGLENDSSYGIWMAEDLLQKAFAIYDKCRKKLCAERVLKRIIAIQEKSRTLYQTRRVEMDLSNFLKKIDTDLRDMSVEDSLVYLALMTNIWKVETIKDKTINNQNTYSSLATIILTDRYGRRSAILPSLKFQDSKFDPELLEKHMHYQAAKMEQMNGLLLRFAKQIMLGKHQVTIHQLRIITEGNPIIPEGRESIILSAFEMFFSDKVTEAMYLLVPQVENIIRSIAKELGGITTTIKDECEEDKSLGSIFKIPELIDGYDERILFLLKGLLTENTGSNIRNQVAHGILVAEEAQSDICCYFFCFVLRWFFLTAPGFYRIIHTNEKIRDSLKPREDDLSEEDTKK